MTRISEHFNKLLFQCKCGCGLYNLSPKLLLQLLIARTYGNVPFVITSGCRCILHNKNVGGVSDSAHIIGMAADIKFKTGYELYNIIAGLYKAKIYRIGINFNKSFVHVDIDYQAKPYPTVFKY